MSGAGFGDSGVVGVALGASSTRPGVGGTLHQPHGLRDGGGVALRAGIPAKPLPEAVLIRISKIKDPMRLSAPYHFTNT